MFETLTLTTILLISFFFYQNYRLGLTSSVPKDPNNRVHFYCSECLTALKALLPQATVQEIKSDLLRFTPADSQVSHQLAMEEGKLILSVTDKAPQSLAFLGSLGSVNFEQASDTGLFVTVEAKTPEASHKISLRLEVAYS